MTQFAQTKLQTLHRQSNAIDLGRVGFADDDEMISLCHACTVRAGGGAVMTAG